MESTEERFLLSDLDFSHEGNHPLCPLSYILLIRQQYLKGLFAPIPKRGNGEKQRPAFAGWETFRVGKRPFLRSADALFWQLLYAQTAQLEGPLLYNTFFANPIK